VRTAVSLSTLALDRLVRSLREEFRARGRGPQPAPLLGEYARAERDWREFALFSEHGYTRNLVAREPEFELLILCWRPGQESAIHNHEGQDCWMAVLAGDIEEQRYAWPDGSGALCGKGAMTFREGEVAFIRDEMGLHLVRPSAPSAAGGITLHLYSTPFDECNCYCPDTGRVTRKKLALHSVRGQILRQADDVGVV
jgi:cysteine dioxygenase